MKNCTLTFLLLSSWLPLQAQRISNASYMQASPLRADVHVPFRYHDAGIKTPIEWGLDLAWRDEANVRRGVFYAGKDIIDMIRLSFQPTASVESGNFTQAQLNDLNYRVNAVRTWCKPNVGYNLNCDHPSIDSWYKVGPSSNYTERAARWAKLIDMTADYYKSKGLKNLVSISPFNEPDYGWDQGYSSSTRKADLRAICQYFKENEAYKDKYANVRLCTGNTLNTDGSYEWWAYTKNYADEGNTHQLAGSFDNYANFFQKVREAGHHATADELHNVMEAMVGVEYGMQTGIWWGTCERTRAEFMKATYQGNPGDRLAYAEHRPNWTSASVYRLVDGRLQAFAGTSERQAVTTSYQYTALDRPVFYNGIRGRSYTLNVLGGTGYQNGQTGFETVIDVQSGEDVMPYIDGVYKIVNANSGFLLSATSASPSGWQNLLQLRNLNANPVHMQWEVRPSTLDGDRAYHTIRMNTPVVGEKADTFYIDVRDWNYNAGAPVGTYKGGKIPNTIQQWYLEYAGDNCFYIRSRYSTKCIEVPKSSRTSGAALKMAEINGGANQKWRFIPVEVRPNNKRPASPTQLTATAQAASVVLSWQAPEETDIASYTVLRSEDGTDFYTLCTKIPATTFTDNEAEDGKVYYYKVYCEDESGLRSVASEVVQSHSNADKALILSLPLHEASVLDETENDNHAALCGAPSIQQRQDKQAMYLDGQQHYLQLPYTIASHDELTVSLWVNSRSSKSWQRIFDFGNSQEQYLFLTSHNASGQMRFAIKNGGAEQYMDAPRMTTQTWHHVALTMKEGETCLYVDGALVASRTNITIKPSDIAPVNNYIGRSQYGSDPLLAASVCDVRIYNYALTKDEVSELTTGINQPQAQGNLSPTDEPTYDLSGRKVTATHKGITVKQGKKVIQ